MPCHIRRDLAEYLLREVIQVLITALYRLILVIKNCTTWLSAFSKKHLKVLSLRISWVSGCFSWLKLNWVKHILQQSFEGNNHLKPCTTSTLHLCANAVAGQNWQMATFGSAESHKSTTRRWGGRFASWDAIFEMFYETDFHAAEIG